MVRKLKEESWHKGKQHRIMPDGGHIHLSQIPKTVKRKKHVIDVPNVVKITVRMTKDKTNNYHLWMHVTDRLITRKTRRKKYPIKELRNAVIRKALLMGLNSSGIPVTEYPIIQDGISQIAIQLVEEFRGF